MAAMLLKRSKCFPQDLVVDLRGKGLGVHRMARSLRGAFPGRFPTSSTLASFVRGPDVFVHSPSMRAVRPYHGLYKVIEVTPDGINTPGEHSNRCGLSTKHSIIAAPSNPGL
eukprot:5323969-Amphidinium_carterae.1